MKPLDEKLDVNFMQALKCVGFRLHNRHQLKRNAYAHLLGLRYGLVGAAATHQLLTRCEVVEEQEALALIRSWPIMVEEHVRWAAGPRLSFSRGDACASLVASVAGRTMQTYLMLYRRICPLDSALAIARDVFLEEHRGIAGEGWLWWQKARARKRFRTAADESLAIALHFYDRREADLDEVPEIALIGE